MACTATPKLRRSSGDKGRQPAGGGCRDGSQRRRDTPTASIAFLSRCISNGLCSTTLDEIGRRKDAGASDVYIKQCEIELRRLRQAQRVIDARCFCNDMVTEIFQHFRNHHADQSFVFDKKYGKL